MKLNKHERIIKEKIQSFQPDLDKEALWESLSQHVPATSQKKKKRRLGFFLIFMILTFGSIVGFILNNNHSKTKPANSIEHKIKNNDKTNTKAKNDKVNNNLAKNGEFIEQSIPKSNKDIAIKKYSDIVSRNDNKSIVLTQNNVSHQEISNTKNNLDLPKKTIVDNKQINTQTIQNIGLGTVLKSIKRKLKPLPKALTFVGTPMVDLIKIPKLHQSNRLALNLGFGIGDFNHSFVPNNSDSEIFTDNIEAKTKPSWNIEVGVIYYFGNKFYVRSGIEFTQLVTQLHPKWEFILTEQNPYYNGLSQRVVKQLEYEAIAHNYQNTFDIPVGIGIRLLDTKKLNISIESGILWNAYTYSKGVVLDEKYKLHYYDNNKNNPYGRFGIGWRVSTVFDYQIRKNISVYFNPHYTSKSINYTYSKLNIKEIYSIYNFKVGINYKM